LTTLVNLIVGDFSPRGQFGWQSIFWLNFRFLAFTALRAGSGRPACTGIPSPLGRARDWRSGRKIGEAVARSVSGCMIGEAVA